MGMCGPILVGFSQAFERANEKGGGKASVWRDMAWYHAGRIWTYSLLGFLVGLLGNGLRHGSEQIGWQKWTAVGLSAAVILSGLMLLGIIPGLRVDKLATCGVKRFGRFKWFEQLLAGQGAWPRLLLGVIMGFLPCGLVYAMLAVVAVFPTPLHSAIGMLVFGLGTLPSLTALLGATRWVRNRLSESWQQRFRAHGTRLAAVLIILAGGWMLFRSLQPHEDCCSPDSAKSTQSVYDVSLITG